MNRLLDWFDNPIFVKHRRSRLRLQPLLSSLVVVVVLSLCVVWGGVVLDGFTHGGAFGVLMGLQCVTLIIIGAAQVGTAVAGTRETGILDFHRVSPLSPTALTLGFFFGAPIREYVLFAATLPFALFCILMGVPTFSDFIQLMLFLVISAWIFHALALLSALSAKKPKQAAQGAIGMLVFLLLFFGSMIGGVFRAALIVQSSPTLSFFGVPLPWFLFMLLYQLPTLFFLFLACRRKMHSERTHAFAKPHAVAVLCILSFLMVGGLWGVSDAAVPLGTIVLYALVSVAVMMVPSVTSTLGEYAKGIRRAEKLGRKHLSYWHDLALNRVVLAILCVVVLIGATTAWNVLTVPLNAFGKPDLSRGSLTIAIGVLVVAYFGLALQFFQLRFPKRAVMYFGLFLFLAWLVPILAGTVFSLQRGPDRGVGEFAFALSPVAGLGLSSYSRNPAEVSDARDMGVRAAAFLPALVFAFVFNNLVVSARRRADAIIHAGPEKAVAEVVELD